MMMTWEEKEFVCLKSFYVLVYMTLLQFLVFLYQSLVIFLTLCLKEKAVYYDWYRKLVLKLVFLRTMEFCLNRNIFNGMFYRKFVDSYPFCPHIL